MGSGEVSVTITVAGSVDTYSTKESLEALKKSFAEKFGVTDNQIILSISGGSVNIKATVAGTTPAQAAAVALIVEKELVTVKDAETFIKETVKPTMVKVLMDSGKSQTEAEAQATTFVSTMDVVAAPKTVVAPASAASKLGISLMAQLMIAGTMVAAVGCSLA